MSRRPWEWEERMSASWREGWEVGHTLQERSQPLQSGARRESRDTVGLDSAVAVPGWISA